MNFVKNKNISMAKKILKEIGITEKKYNVYLTPRGKIYEDTYYEYYGLKIINSGFQANEKILTIYYNGQKVLDKKTYVPGIWEDILEELYIKAPIIKNQQRIKENYIKRKLSILYIINSISTQNKIIKINDNIKIISQEEYSNCEKQRYKGTLYQVYENDKLVFKGYYSYFCKKDKVYEYIPGNWEEELIKYKKAIEKQSYNFSKKGIKKLCKLK